MGAAAAGLVIFDLDGTLVDSEPNHLAAEQLLLAEFGILGFDARAKRRYIGLSTTELLTDLTTRYGLGEPPERLALRKDELYIELARVHTPVYEPMRRFVAALSAHGLPLAVASGSTSAALDVVLEATALRGYFSVVLSSDAVKHGKPEPDLFLETAGRAGADPEHCVVIEDSHHGREAARRAGMRCVFVPADAGQLHGPADVDTELVFGEGMAAFDPERALDWVLSRIW